MWIFPLYELQAVENVPWGTVNFGEGTYISKQYYREDGTEKSTIVENCRYCISTQKKIHSTFHNNNTVKAREKITGVREKKNAYKSLVKKLRDFN